MEFRLHELSCDLRLEHRIPRASLPMQASIILLSVVTYAQVQKFEVYSEPIYLRPGEVHNQYVKPKALPKEIASRFAGKAMYLKSMQLDIVRYDEETKEETQLPLYEAYNHHHALLIGSHDGLEKVNTFVALRNDFDNISFV